MTEKKKAAKPARDDKAADSAARGSLSLSRSMAATPKPSAIRMKSGMPEEFRFNRPRCLRARRGQFSHCVTACTLPSRRTSTSTRVDSALVAATPGAGLRPAAVGDARHRQRRVRPAGAAGAGLQLRSAHRLVGVLARCGDPAAVREGFSANSTQNLPLTTSAGLGETPRAPLNFLSLSRERHLHHAPARLTQAMRAPKCR